MSHPFKVQAEAWVFWLTGALLAALAHFISYLLLHSAEPQWTADFEFPYLEQAIMPFFPIAILGFAAYLLADLAGIKYIEYVNDQPYEELDDLHKGDTHTVRGALCTVMVFGALAYLGLLWGGGWLLLLVPSLLLAMVVWAFGPESNAAWQSDILRNRGLATD